MQHRTDEVPHDCGRRARFAEQTAVRSRRVRHIAVFGIPKCYMDHGRSSVPPSSDCNYSPRNRDNTVRTEASGSSTAQRDNQPNRTSGATSTTHMPIASRIKYKAECELRSGSSGCTSASTSGPDRPVRTPRGAAVPHGPSGAAAETGKWTI